jgi:hypothetical protein
MSKVVIANYNLQSIFKIPNGLDLEDKTQVHSWGIKWNKLKILLVDETTILTVKPEFDVMENELKFPSDDPTIEDAEDFLETETKK